MLNTIMSSTWPLKKKSSRAVETNPPGRREIQEGEYFLLISSIENGGRGRRTRKKTVRLEFMSRG